MSKIEIKVLFIVSTIVFAVLKRMMESCEGKHDFESEFQRGLATVLILMRMVVIAVLVYYSLVG